MKQDGQQRSPLALLAAELGQDIDGRCAGDPLLRQICDDYTLLSAEIASYRASHADSPDTRQHLRDLTESLTALKLEITEACSAPERCASTSRKRKST